MSKVKKVSRITVRQLQELQTKIENAADYYTEQLGEFAKQECPFKAGQTIVIPERRWNVGRPSMKTGAMINLKIMGVYYTAEDTPSHDRTMPWEEDMFPYGHWRVNGRLVDVEGRSLGRNESYTHNEYKQDQKDSHHE